MLIMYQTLGNTKLDFSFPSTTLVLENRLRDLAIIVVSIALFAIMKVYCLKLANILFKEQKRR